MFGAPFVPDTALCRRRSCIRSRPSGDIRYLGDQRTGTFVWFDLLTHDGDRVRAYYAALFGWDISEAKDFPGYDLIANQGLVIGGIAEIAKLEQPAWFTP